MPSSESTGAIPRWIFDFTSFRSFQDAVVKIVWDRHLFPANVPVTGGKAEVTGGKIEANGVAVNLYGGQFEYGLFQHELSINKVLEDRARDKRDHEVDSRLTSLTEDAHSTRNLITGVRESLDTTAAGIREAFGAGDLKVSRELSDALRISIEALRSQLLEADQVLHQRITALTTRVGEVSSVAHTAEGRTQGLRTDTDKALGKVHELKGEVGEGMRLVHKLDEEVGTGLQRVSALERSAQGADGALRDLQLRVNGLEDALGR
ncbi:hypothetical protein ACGFZS_27730 [Streptomyces sp. NPDC048288]|uniref:hypothetical protein n=1 Tax=Streptomyces sp. NPDC048288 TaxID=3365529 RepID=UPI00371F684E